jgi:hypothetical protein
MNNIIERLFDAKITVSARARDDHDAEVYNALGDASDEIERLRAKCDKQAMIIRRLFPEMSPDTYFISGQQGTADDNGLPEEIHVVPAYGCDWSMVYRRANKTSGPEW